MYLARWKGLKVTWIKGACSPKKGNPPQQAHNVWNL